MRIQVLQVLSSDACYDVLLPIALRSFSSGPAVLRGTAADALIALMRAVQKPYQRTDILCRLFREYALGRSCYKRLAYLDAAAVMLQRYSTRLYNLMLPGSCNIVNSSVFLCRTLLRVSHAVTAVASDCSS